MSGSGRHGTGGVRVAAAVGALAVLLAACSGGSSGAGISVAATGTTLPAATPSAGAPAAPTTTTAATTTAAAAAPTTALPTTVGTTAAPATPAPTSTAPAPTTAGPPPLPGANPTTLEGMRGVTPLVPVTDDFRARLRTVDRGIVETQYAAETYDAVVVVALAAARAGTDGPALAAEIPGVTREGTVCTSVAACLDLIARGVDPDYDGASGRLELGDNGEPTEGTFAVLRFGADNRLDRTRDTYRTASAPTPAAGVVRLSASRRGDGVLKLGSLFPRTGSLDFLHRAMDAGFRLAVADIDAAGGVLGQKVQVTSADSGDTSSDLARSAASALVAEGVDAVIGPASSGVTLRVIDQLTAAGVVMVSPSATSKRLSTYPDRGLFFRVAPSDIVQAAALADLVTDDGVARVGVLALDDVYARGLSDDLARELGARGVDVPARRTYAEGRELYTAEIDALRRAEVDAVVVLGFEESSKVLRALVDAGLGPGQVRVYGCDGNMGDALGRAFAEGR